MAHDYANKPKSKRPAARRNPPKPAPAPRRTLPWAGLLGLVLVAGLGYGLYRLAGIKPDPRATQQRLQQQAAPAKPAAPTPVAKAEPEEKSYRFYQLLPNSEVEPPKVEAYKSTPREEVDYSRHLLQAGSFRSAADADALRAKLLLKGLPNVTTSSVTSSDGSVWYRVRVGPFPSRSKLNKAEDALVRMNLQPMEVKLPKKET